MFGFGYAWIAQDVWNTECFSYLLLERLKDCFIQNWYANMNDSPKADLYKQFKSLLDVEKYLMLELSFKYKRVLANFRYCLIVLW